MGVMCNLCYIRRHPFFKILPYIYTLKNNSKLYDNSHENASLKCIILTSRMNGNTIKTL